MSFRYEHNAMATEFVLVIAREEEEYAISASQKVFELINELESKLSRFIPDSDISRINRLKEGEHIPIDYETWDIMKMAMEVNMDTKHVYDIGVAKHMDVFRAAKQGILSEFEMHKALQKVQDQKQQAQIFLDPDKPMIYCVKEGIGFDLGGIGKGYALDKVKELLIELEIENFFVSAGDSTVLFQNNPEVKPHWNHSLSAKLEEKSIQASNIVISASGTYFQGKHIFNPLTGSNDFEALHDRVWVAAKSAAISDAFSTASYLLTEEDLEEIVAQNEKIIWVALAKAGNIHFIN